MSQRDTLKTRIYRKLESRLQRFFSEIQNTTISSSKVLEYSKRSLLRVNLLKRDKITVDEFRQHVGCGKLPMRQFAENP